MPSAVEKLQRSRLSPKSVQRELMGDDLDPDSILIYFQKKIKFDSIDRVIDVDIERTIEGASTIVLKLNDHDRAILRSGLLSNRLDIELDGLWFRLVKVNKQGDLLNLTFEDREIAILRTYNKLKIAQRANVTRAEFVVNLLHEVKEFKIPHVIPELHRVQPVMANTSGQTIDWDALLNKTKGVAKDVNTDPIVPSSTVDQTQARGAITKKTLTVKGIPADTNQIKNANIIIQVGNTMGARRKVVVSAIMTAIVESSLRNLPYGDRDSLGLFQQRASWGSAEDRLDPATAARLYYLQAIKDDAADPTMGYGELCQTVQVSAFPDRYDKYRTEGERITTAGGMPGTDGEVSAASVNNSNPADTSGGSDYIFYRGTPDSTKKTWKKENSWDCIQRLADDVQWRAFFVSGVFYFLAEDDLIKSLPIATVTESTVGVEGIDGDYDEGKKTATVTLTCRVGSWLVPPGAVIVLTDMGVWNGRWLVTRFNRSLLASSLATITLSKPLPRLPEPLKNDINQPQTPSWGDQAPATADNTYNVQPNTNYINPLPTKMGDNSEFAIPDAQGAPSRLTGIRYHAAKDWFAPGGTVVVAPIAGTLVEVRDSPVESGQVFGGTVKLQQDNGIVWVFRHVHPRAPLAVGARVRAGQGIASVVAWQSGSPHCHIEIWRTLSGGYVYENMIDPVKFIRGEAS